MAKNKLAAEDYFDFFLIGVVSTVKEYKLVWYLNSTLNTQLEKKPDHIIEFQANVKISISNFQHKRQHQYFELLKNRLVSRSGNGQQYLLEELRQFDYLLKFKDETEQTTIKEVLSLVKSIEVIDYAANLEPALIKARDNLIF